MSGPERVSVRSRWNFRWLIAGFVAVSLGGLGAALLFASLTRAESVVVVTRTVYRDQVITAEALGVISVVPAAGLRTVPAAAVSELVGQTASVDLVEGQLVAPGSYGEPNLAEGIARLGLRLSPGRLPASALPPGSPVLLVPVAGTNEAASDGTSVEASVASLPASLVDGAWLVDVNVPRGQAEYVARLAASDRLALVRTAGAAK